jgi:hypothetical protein
MAMFHTETERAKRMKLTKRPDLERGLSSMVMRNAECETERPKQLKKRRDRNDRNGRP